MFFQNKVNKVFNTKDIDLDRESDKIELEKNDMPALLIAGFVTLLPALLIILALILGVSWFFLR